MSCSVLWILPSSTQVSIAAEARSKLFDAFISSLPTASPPTELLYGAASLLQDGAIESPSLVRHSLLFCEHFVVCQLGKDAAICFTIPVLLSFSPPLHVHYVPSHPPVQSSEALLGSDSIVLTMALDSTQYSINVQRAALNFVTTLCGKLEVARTSLLTMMDGLLYSLLNPPGNDIDSLLKAKVQSAYMCPHSLCTFRD